MSNKNTMDKISKVDNKVVYESPKSNKDHIFEMIKEHILDPCTKSALNVLEVSSATGQHISYFAKVAKNDYPKINVEWQPSDYEAELFESIKAYCEEEKVDNVRAPVIVDASKPSSWPIAPSSVDLIFNVNMVHIAPWECCKGLMEGSGKSLVEGGHLLMYGPFLLDNKPTTDSNNEFDISLKARNRLWGLRDIDAVAAVAKENNLIKVNHFNVPFNNFVLLFKKVSKVI